MSVTSRIRMGKGRVYDGSSEWRRGSEDRFVIGDPLPERSRGLSRHLLDGRRDMRGQADGGGPRVEQHVHRYRWESELAACFVRRQLFELNRPADDVTDDVNLLALRE